MLKFASLFLSCSVWAAAQSSYAGVWVDASQHLWFKIDQQGNDFGITIRTPVGEQAFKAAVGQDSKTSVRGIPFTSRADWDGAALMFRVRGNVDGTEIVVTQRYTLSADKNALTVSETHKNGDQPEATVKNELTRRPVSAWSKEPPVYAATDLYKNIQAMKDHSATDLIAAMNRFTRALGVNCQHCHVENHFESDDKPAKQTARKMIEMVRAIDSQNFPSSNAVTCWTCHRGGLKPESNPPAAATSAPLK